MTAVISAFLWDVRLQYRAGFYHAAAFVLLFWLAVGRGLITGSAQWLLPPLLAGNLLMAGFYFVCGFFLLERDEGTLEARRVTPLSTRGLLGARAAGLLVLGLIENVLVALILSGLPAAPILLLLGLIGGMAILIFLGVIAVSRHASLNTFLMPSMLWSSVIALPTVTWLLQWHHPALVIHPIQAAMEFLRAAYEPAGATGDSLWLAALSLVLWASVLARLAGRALRSMQDGEREAA